MTLVDWIIVVVIAGSVVAGIAQGFLRSAFSLGGLLLGLVVAAWNYMSIAAVIKPIIHNSQVANAIAFLLIAVLVAAVTAIVGGLLSKAFHKIGLGCLDSLAGGIFGLLSGSVAGNSMHPCNRSFFPRNGMADTGQVATILLRCLPSEHASHPIDAR